MSKYQVDAVLPHSVNDVATACQEAVAQLGLSILDQSDSGLTCKEEIQLTSFNNPAKVEVTWRQDGNKTKLTFNGSNFGLGPIQSGHVKGVIGNIQNRIQLCLRKAASQLQPPPSTFNGIIDLKCQNCGGQLELSPDSELAQCQYCGRKSYLKH